MISRRTFGKALGLGAGAGAAALVGALPHPGEAAAALPSARPPSTTPHPGFTNLKHVRAGVLDVGYAELGPHDGPVVICLHGWPYDIHSFVDVAPALAGKGYRVIVPYLRGHGTTRFRSSNTPRNAQQAAVASDVVHLMDALHIRRAVLAGFDWGARTADIVAAIWPRRCKALVSVSGYLITSREANLKPLPAKAEHTWWYQFYFSTERGRLAMEDRQLRHDLTRIVWEDASPSWKFDDATFERTAAAFDNPDYAAVVVHNYRWRLSLADGERRYDWLEAQLAGRPVIRVPTVTLDAELDPFTPPDAERGYRDRFVGPYRHRALSGVGHNLPQEAPDDFVRAVIDADHL